MSFPYNDRFWVDVAAFLRPLAGARDTVLAPDDFWQLFPRIHRYINTRLRPEMDYDWAVIHKGQLCELAPEFARRLVRTMAPVFANEVFVVWSAPPRATPLPQSGRQHVQPLVEAIAAPALDRGDAPQQSVDDPVLPDPGEISQFEFLGIGELKDAMNSFWRRGGYRAATHRDHACCADLDSRVAELLGDAGGCRILDLSCGASLPPCADAAEMIVGVDISEVAVRRAAAAYRDRPGSAVAVMDAHSLAFASASFDIVSFTESIEQMHDAAAVIAEIHRVLKPGGRVLVSTPNANSLHLVMSRKLGYPTFKTSFQHIREFTFDEVCDLLQQAGFVMSRSEGVFLYPYWGIPGIDQIARPIADSDPELIEVMRELGRRVGPEHAYLFIILAEKPPG